MSDTQYFTNDRVVEHNGYLIKASDPYGLWSIHSAKGSLPKALDGEFTGTQEAKKKIDWYINSLVEKENKPPLDKNTRKVQEVLAARTGE